MHHVFRSLSDIEQTAGEPRHTKGGNNLAAQS